MFIGDRDKDYPKPDGKTTFDKLSSVFASGNATRDDAPNHIRIQERVPLEVALMWQNMCPAAVYEVPEDELEAARGGRQRQARRQARGQAPGHAIELRAVRGDHREGRPPDAPGRRRRPELPGHLSPASLVAAARLESRMKPDIHPEYGPSHVRCTCGNEFWTRSTKPELHVEICSNCHPFYTGRQKLVDTGGRVERFRRRAARSRR